MKKVIRCCQYRFFQTVCVLASVLAWVTVQAEPQLNSPRWLLQQWEHNGTYTDLASHNATVQTSPASITKLFTAYTVLYALKYSVNINNNTTNTTTNNINNNNNNNNNNNKANINNTLFNKPTLDTLLPISALAVAQEGSKVGYKIGEVVTVQDALQGMLAISGNDAAWALAEFFGKGNAANFVAQMSIHSKRLGLAQSIWNNPHGLTHEQHLSSAADLLRISHALWYEFPLARPWLSLKKYTWNGVTQKNRNPLLYLYQGADGLKTGYTKIAGYNLATTSQLKFVAGTDYYNWRLSAITLGATTAKNRELDNINLITWAKNNFVAWKFFSRNQVLGKLIITNIPDAISVYTPESIWLVLPKKYSPQQLRYELVPRSKLSLPIAAGQTIATVNIYSNIVGHIPKLLLTLPAMSINAVQSTSLWSRLMAWIQYSNIKT